MKKIALVVGLIFSMQATAVEVIWYMAHGSSPYGSGFNTRKECEDFIKNMGSSISCVPIVKSDR